MNIYQKLAAGVIVLLVGLLVLGPLVVLLAALLIVLGLFGLAVIVWALVLYAERWIAGDLHSGSVPEALVDSLQDLVQGLRLELFRLRSPAVR